jgi:hypothetical protein
VRLLKDMSAGRGGAPAPIASCYETVAEACEKAGEWTCARELRDESQARGF